MRKITYSDYMNDEFTFNTQHDKRIVEEHWVNDYELFVDELGRVYTESDLYIADIEINR